MTFVQNTDASKQQQCWDGLVVCVQRDK